MNTKKLLEIIKESKAFIAGLLGTFTALVGLVILYRNNVELFLLILIAMFLAGVIICCVYLIKAQTQSNVIGTIKRHKFPRARQWAIIYLLLFPILIIGSFFMKPVQNFTSIAIYGTPTLTPTLTTVPPPTLTTVPQFTSIPNKPNIKTILIGSKDSLNTIEINLHNPLKQELIVTHIKVKAKQEAITGGWCWCPYPSCGEFTVSNQISLTNKNNSELEFTSSVTRETGMLAGYMFPANGLVSFDCGFYGIELNFDTSLIIPADKYFFFLVNIPSSFETTTNSKNGIPLEKDRLESVYFPIYRQQPKYFFLELYSPSEIRLTTIVELTINSGELISFTLFQ